MSDPSAESTDSYGERFAETWKQLQRYLADLDPAEMKQLHGKDFDATLKVLQAQPALGMTPALQGADDRSPEDLAIAIVKDRLQVLEQSFGSRGREPWGAQLLTSLRDRRVPISYFRYATIQELKDADRATALSILRRHMMLPASWESASSPEQMADELLRAWQLRQITYLALF